MAFIEVEGLFLDKLINKSFVKKIGKISNKKPAFFLGVGFGKKDFVFIVASPKPRELRRGICTMISTNKAMVDKIIQIIEPMMKKRKKGKR